MVNSDIFIVALVVLISTTYGVFFYMYASDTKPSDIKTDFPVQNYTSPSSGGFWDTINGAVNVNLSEEAWYINTIIFSVLGILLVMVGLRFMRGQ